MSDESDMSLLPWILTGVVSVVGALSTALIYVFRKAEFDNAVAIKDLKDSNASLFAANANLYRMLAERDEERSKAVAQIEVLQYKLTHVEAKLCRIDETGTQHSLTGH